MRNESLIKENVNHALIKFAIPFLLANLLQVLYGATDLIVVGQFASTADVSAVSIGSQIMGLLTQFILGLTAGTTILLGQYFGARKEQDMARVIGTTIWLFFGLSLGIMGLLFLFRSPIISVMNTPVEAVSATGDYLFICSIGTVFIIGYNVVSSILRGLGDSRTPLLFVGIACIINIFLDILLVGPLEMGAAGAAIATVIAQAASLIFSLLYLYRKGLGFPIHREDLNFRGFYASRILKTGAPVGLQNGLVGISFLLITLITNRMGVTVSASVGVVEKLVEFLMLPSSAFSTAVAAMSAQNFGAHEFGRAKKCMRSGVWISFAFGAAVALFCQFGGQLLTALFSNDPEVIRMGAQYLQTYSIDCVLVAFVFNLNGYFNGAGHAMFSMLHSLVTTFAIRIPFTLFASHIPNVTLTLVGCAAPLSTLGSLLLCLAYLFWLGRHPERLTTTLADEPTLE